MELGSRFTNRGKRRFSSLPVTSTTTAAAVAKVPSQSEQTEDVYDIDNIDEDEIEFLKETTKFPRIASRIRDDRSSRMKSRIGRKQNQEEDIDKLLKEQGLYEEDMTYETKKEIFAVLLASRETAANEKSFREGNDFEKVSPVNKSENLPSPVLFEDSNTLPADDSDSPETKPNAFQSSQEDGGASPVDSDEDFEVRFRPMSQRIGSKFHISPPRLSERNAKGDESSLKEKAASDEEAEAKPRMRTPYNFNSRPQASKPMLFRNSTAPTRLTSYLRQPSMLTQIPNVWPDPPDTRKDVPLPIPDKRKRSAQMSGARMYCRAGEDPSECANNIIQSFECYRKRLRHLQKSSLNFIPWSEPISKVFKYRPVSKSSESTKNRMSFSSDEEFPDLPATNCTKENSETHLFNNNVSTSNSEVTKPVFGNRLSRNSIRQRVVSADCEASGSQCNNVGLPEPWLEKHEPSSDNKLHNENKEALTAQTTAGDLFDEEPYPMKKESRTFSKLSRKRQRVLSVEDISQKVCPSDEL